MKKDIGSKEDEELMETGCAKKGQEFGSDTELYEHAHVR